MPLTRCRPGFTDYIFKTVHGVPLPLRFWPAAPAASTKLDRRPSPWLLWVHGGGYTCGKWSAPTPWVSRAFADAGFAVVSVGYRLQPQASFHDMVADCVDAAAWAAENLPKLQGVSGARWAVGGASSGATLAAMTALLAQPAPKALVSVYGLLDTAHYLTDEKARELPVDEYVECNETELEALVADRDPRNAVTQNPWAGEMPPAVPLDEARAAFGLADWVPTRTELVRHDLYTYVAKHKNLIDVIYRRERFPVGAEGDAAFRHHVAGFSPTQLLDTLDAPDARTPDTHPYPPTFFMHGDADNIVPTAQTTAMAAKLVQLGVPHRVYYEPGAGHVYDFAFEIPEDKGWAENVEPCIAFVSQHVRDIPEPAADSPERL